MSPLILHATELAPATPTVVLGSGMPAKLEGHDVYYRDKEVAKVGKYIHRGSGEAFEITADRMDKWVDAFKKRFAKGIRPFITPYHVDHKKDPDARETLGYVVGLKREGDTLIQEEQLIGNKALEASAKNYRSIFAVGDALDADGDVYPESLHHTAMTPNPALTNLGGYMTIAASAGGGAAQVPIYELSAAARSTPMKAETLLRLRAKLKLAPEIKDEDVAEQAAILALADPPPNKTAEVTALSASVTKLQGELDAEKAKVLSLSASAPREPDALSLAMFGENIDAKREAAIRSGAVSTAEAKLFDALLANADGQPNTLALSACGTSRKPFGFQFWDAIGKLSEGESGRVRVGNEVLRASAATPPTHVTYTGEQQQKQLTPEELEAAVKQELGRTGLGRKVLAERKS